VAASDGPAAGLDPVRKGASRARGPAAGDLTLVGLLNLTLRQRRLIVLCAAVTLVLGAGVRLLLPRTYTATSSFMPQSRRATPSLSGLAAQFGLALPGVDPGQSPAFYSDLVKTRPILSDVAAGRYEVHTRSGLETAALADLLQVKVKDSLRREEVIARLRKIVAVDVALKTGVVELRVTTRYPALSAQLNRRILELLNAFNLQTRQSQAAQERRFTERRLGEVAVDLRQAEDKLQAFLQRNRDYRNSPQLNFEYERLAREVAMRQQVYTSLAQALEQARIEEVRDTPVITIVENPEAPVRPDPRGLAKTGLLALLAGAVIGVVAALGRESVTSGVAAQDRQWLEFAALMQGVATDIRHPLASLGRLLRRERRDGAATRETAA
jgi:uncharacterized protein involved in exopolysaccharide biosynthesis